VVIFCFRGDRIGISFCPFYFYFFYFLPKLRSAIENVKLVSFLLQLMGLTGFWRRDFVLAQRPFSRCLRS
jgi:hypothetical protein